MAVSVGALSFRAEANSMRRSSGAVVFESPGAQAGLRVQSERLRPIAIEHDRHDLLERPRRRGGLPIEPEDHVEAVSRPMGGNARHDRDQRLRDGSDVFVLPAHQHHALGGRNRIRETGFLSLGEAKIDIDFELGRKGRHRLQRALALAAALTRGDLRVRCRRGCKNGGWLRQYERLSERWSEHLHPNAGALPAARRERLRIRSAAAVDCAAVLVGLLGVANDQDRARAFDEKAESIVDSHDGTNQIQHPHWYKGGQS
jgi:hypothetical protein